MFSEHKPSSYTDLPSVAVTPEGASQLDEAIKPEIRLTPREKEIALWISRGSTSGAIAEILMISKRTVNKHVEHIFDKLDIANRKVLISLIQQHVTREDAVARHSDPRSKRNGAKQIPKIPRQDRSTNANDSRC